MTDPKDPLHVCSECGCELPEGYEDAICEDCLEELEQLEQEESE